MTTCRQLFQTFVLYPFYIDISSRIERARGKFERGKPFESAWKIASENFENHSSSYNPHVHFMNEIVKFLRLLTRERGRERGLLWQRESLKFFFCDYEKFSFLFLCCYFSRDTEIFITIFFYHRNRETVAAGGFIC